MRPAYVSEIEWQREDHRVVWFWSSVGWRSSGKSAITVQIITKDGGYGCMVFFNMNICRNNTEDIQTLTEYARDNRIATDYHINEKPMIEQDEHFKHLSDNPAYIRPEDWPEIDSLVDWLIEKNKAGYQMVNSVQRLQEIKAFIRMASGADLSSGTVAPVRTTSSSEPMARSHLVSRCTPPLTTGATSTRTNSMTAN